MKGIALALFWLLGSSSAFAIQPQPTTQVAPVNSVEVLSMPSREELTEAYNASGLSKAAGIVIVAYDDTGKILGVKLDKPTGSASLDAAIMAWAAQVKLKATSSGTSSMPFAFGPK